MQKTLPLLMDFEKIDIFKDEGNLCFFEVATAKHEGLNLQSRIMQSKKGSFKDHNAKDRESFDMGKIFYKDGKWFITKTIQPKSYDVVKEVTF